MAYLVSHPDEVKVVSKRFGMGATSLDRYLEQMIEKAKVEGSIFGLVYVDLDEFKQVNDFYGHHVGDLYLQEVSMRMKRQLRSGDMLARLGGDEFAALVPVVHGRAAIEEIAQRMERCFDAPFAVEGYVLRGGASGGRRNPASRWKGRRSRGW